jgi:hypothetical protein
MIAFDATAKRSPFYGEPRLPGGTVESNLAVKPDSNDLVVIFKVNEGPRSTVAEVAVRGNSWSHPRSSHRGSSTMKKSSRLLAQRTEQPDSGTFTTSAPFLMQR